MNHKKTTDVRQTDSRVNSSDSECIVFNKQITDYFAGELADAASEKLMTHLEECDACRKDFEEFDDLWSSAGEALTEDKTPEALSDERKEFIISAVELAAEKQKKSRSLYKIILEYGAVAAILLIFAGMLLPPLNSSRGRARIIAAKSEAKQRQLESLSEEDGFVSAVDDESNVIETEPMDRVLKNYRADSIVSDRRTGGRLKPASAPEPVLSAAPMERAKQVTATSNWSFRQNKDSKTTFGDDSNRAEYKSRIVPAGGKIEMLSVGKKYKRKAGDTRSISRERMEKGKSELKKDYLNRRNESTQIAPGSPLSSVTVTGNRPVMQKSKMDYAYRKRTGKKIVRVKELSKGLVPEVKLEEAEARDIPITEPRKAMVKRSVDDDKQSEGKIMIELPGRAGELREKTLSTDIKKIAAYHKLPEKRISVQRKEFKLNLKLWNITTTQNLRALMQQRGYPLTARVSINRHDNTVTFYDTAGNLNKAAELFSKLQASEKALKDYRNGIPMLKTKLRPISTFSIDTDTASYIQAKRMIMNGQRPDPMKIREEEFINYFDYHYRSPVQGAFGVYLEAAPAPFRSGKTLLRIGVQGKKLGPDSGTASRYTVLLDGSGSMASGKRLELAFKTLRLLFSKLGVRDRASLIVCGETSERLFTNSGPVSKVSMVRQLTRIKPHGAADFNTGLRMAYQTASRNYCPGGINKVIIISDGIVKLTEDQQQVLLSDIDRYRRRGISNIVIGLGGDGDDELLEKLAAAGDGSYVFIDRKQDAVELFSRQFDARFREIARDVKIQVEFNAVAVPEYRQVGYSNRQLSKADFRNDNINAGEVGSGQSVTAVYEMNINHEVPPKTMLAIVRLRYKDVDCNEVREEEFTINLNEIYPAFDRATPGFRLASLVAEFAELLRFPETPGIASGSGIAAKLSSLFYNNYRNDGKVAELLMLTRKVK